MASLRAAFEAYAEELLAGASAETVKACEEAFFGGAATTLNQVEDPSRSFAQQRNRLRALATEVHEYQMRMVLRPGKTTA